MHKIEVKNVSTKITHINSLVRPTKPLTSIPHRNPNKEILMYWHNDATQVFLPHLISNGRRLPDAISWLLSSPECVWALRVSSSSPCWDNPATGRHMGKQGRRGGGRTPHGRRDPPKSYTVWEENNSNSFCCHSNDIFVIHWLPLHVRFEIKYNTTGNCAWYELQPYDVSQQIMNYCEVHLPDNFPWRSDLHGFYMGKVNPQAVFL